MKSSILSAKFSDATAHFSRHYHDCHEMFYVTDGRAKITVGAKQYSVSKGHLIIISRYEKHSVTVESDDYKRYTLRLKPDIYGDSDEDYMLYSVLTNRPESFVHAVDVSQSCEVFDSLFSKILSEFTYQKEYCGVLLDMYLKQILVELYRLEGEMFSHTGDASLGLVRDIQSLFQKNCGEKYTISALSETYNISGYYLCHLFKKVTGYSLMNYLLSCRIANAKKLLAKTDMDVSAVAGECGFCDSSNFSRKFREETGISPTDFRKNTSLHQSKG